ncbi:nSTAND1 domain-containing NTPase [Vacuolonema iberomarrocanum]|uniref:nSTAND1 domain-containing NTPase n=1 Tax=Vacuolonema iberomarrocanum TaxID=3454632 RepID=UPI0019DDA889|nr:caspase family protein [filamentous cyanobacterium LEGE 07170]
MARRYALVIGIRNYTRPLNCLSKTVTDAEAVAKILEERGGFEVTRLTEDVTSDRLIQAIRILLLQKAPGQDALIYFTGHGIPVMDPVLEETEAFLATSDCRVAIEQKQVIQQQKGIPLSSLNTLIGRSRLSSLVVLLDCCHGGERVEFIDKAVLQTALTSLAGRDYFLIAACRSFEQAYARRSEEHSIFTGALLQGLQTAQDEAGVVTAEALSNFIKRELQGSGQEPISLGSGGIVPIAFYQTAVTPTEIDEACPYQGLLAFTEATKQFFHGRSRTTEAVQQALEQSSVVILVGASGSGKSSVAQAGVIPALRSLGWRILLPIKPGFEPMAELKRSLTQAVHRRDDTQAVMNAVEQGTLAEAIAHIPGTERLLLLVDQFEEVFTLCSSDREQQRFIERLMGDVGDRLSILITLRADFVDACLQHGSLATHLQHHAIYIPPLEGDDLQAAIQKPALHQGYQLDPALLSVLLRDVDAEPNSLPLLQFALARLWDVATQAGHCLTLKQYEALGGLKGALNEHANRIYAFRDWREPTPQTQRSDTEKEWIRRICLQLVRTGSENRDTRQRRSKAELLELAGQEDAARTTLETVLAELVDGRLLVSGDGEDRTAIDLAHEALMKGWEIFAKWREGDRELRRLIDRIDDARREWQHSGHNPDFFLPKALIVQAATFADQLVAILPNNLHTYYQASLDYDRERTADLKWVQLERDFPDAARRIQTHLQSNGTGENLAAALELVHRNLQAQPNQPPLGIIQDTLHQGMTLAREQNRFHDHQASVLAVAFSPDGKTIVSGSDDRTLRLWQLDGTPIGQPFHGHQASVGSVAFSPNGKTIVSGSDDGTVRLWQLDGTPIGQPFYGHEDAVWAIAFSPNGKTIVSGSADRTLRLWQLDGTPIDQPFHGHEDYVRSVAFSPNGKTIVSGSYDRTLRLWQLDGTPIGQPFHGHDAFIWSVAFSPDGKTIVSSSDDCTVRLWQLDGTPIGQPFRGHEDYIGSVAFSPDGNTILSGSDDGTVRLWQLDGTPIGQPFYGHEDCIWSVTFSPKEQTIASGSADGTVRLWQLNDICISQPFHGHEESAALSPDGRTIVSSGADGTIDLWHRDNWQDWVRVCCERLRYHPVFRDPPDAMAREACEFCREFCGWGE